MGGLVANMHKNNAVQKMPEGKSGADIAVEARKSVKQNEILKNVSPINQLLK